MEQPYKNILNNITTKEQVEEVLSCIDAILESFYSTKKTDYKKIIDKSLRSDLANVLEKALDTFDTLDTPDTLALKDYLADLKDKLTKFKVIKLTIAFSPTPNSISTISAFIKEQFGEDFIIDLEEDPKILGGAIIEYNGKYTDLTLKKQMDEVFEEKKDEIEMLIKC